VTSNPFRDDFLERIRGLILHQVLQWRSGATDGGLWWANIETGALVRPLASFEEGLGLGSRIGGLIVTEGAESVAREKKTLRRIGSEFQAVPVNP